MKGEGEPVLEFDFSPGSDMVGEIMKGPNAAERMEVELFSRLALLDVNNASAQGDSEEGATQGG